MRILKYPTHNLFSVKSVPLGFCRAHYDVSFFGQTVEFERADDPLGCKHRVINAVKGVFVAVAFVNKCVRATIDRIHLLDGHCDIFRADPLTVKLRIGVCTKYEFTRSFEFADDEKFLPACLRRR